MSSPDLGSEETKIVRIANYVFSRKQEAIAVSILVVCVVSIIALTIIS